MPRTISEELKAHFAGMALTVCTCVKLERTDGVVMGFTNIASTITYEGVDYIPQSTLQATVTHASSDTGVDNLDITGILDDERILARDVSNGVYRRAKITIFRLNYNDLTMGHIVTFSGYIGRISMVDDNQFTAEVLSLSSLLNQSVGSETSSICRCRKFGDGQCKVVLASYQHVRSISGVDSNKEMTFGSDTHATGYFDNGLILFTTGVNAGLSREVKAHTLVAGEAHVVTRLSFPEDVEVGDEAVLTRGCDFTFETCRDTYNNAINFRGEPHLPGTETILKVGRE